jgi:hypothetical protein
MERPVIEQEAKGVLRNLEREREAQAILAVPPERKLPLVLGPLAAALVAWFAFRDFDAPDIAVALLVAMFVGVVGLSVELWMVRRRLESVIELVKLRDHEQP